MTLESIKSLLRPVPDFPKKGILFQDIFPVFQNPDATKELVDILSTHIKSIGDINVIVGPWIASRLGISFVPVRKSGKLPPPTHKITYVLEYGTDSFEISQTAIKAGDRVVVLDDLIATGGSAQGAGELVSQCGGVVVENVFMIELTALKGRDKLKGKTFSLFQFDD
ncbi:adenine phosphoribosyltransferase [Kappamyces sp. JEL0680]|nr:adenine phosphoribosyltransferase [Kappamyces sp. JEL0680]